MKPPVVADADFYAVAITYFQQALSFCYICTHRFLNQQVNPIPASCSEIATWISFGVHAMAASTLVVESGRTCTLEKSW